MRLDKSAAVRTLQEDLNKVAAKLRLKIPSLNLEQIGQLTNTINRLATQFRQVNTQLDGVRSRMTQISNSQQRISQNQNTINTSTRGYLENLGKVVKKFSDWIIAGTLFYQPLKLFKDGLQTLKEIDTILVDIAKVTNMTNEEMKKLALTGAQVGQEFGRTAQEYLRMYSSFAKMGFKEQAGELTEAALLLANVGDMTDEQASKSLIGTMAGFRLEAEESTNVIDKMNAVKWTPPSLVTKNEKSDYISETLIYFACV